MALVQVRPFPFLKKGISFKISFILFKQKKIDHLYIELNNKEQFINKT